MNMDELGSDWYQVLGVPEDATSDVIKKKYHMLCRKYHPDKAKSEEEAQRNTVMMFKINEAKEILLDPARRRDYDALHRAGTFGQADEDYPAETAPGGDYERHRPASARPARPRPTGLGQPYSGNVFSPPFFYNGDGGKGLDGWDGKHGSDGYAPGRSGEDGTNAGPAYVGEPGKDLRIHLATVVAEEGYFEVEVRMGAEGDVLDPQYSDADVAPLKCVEKIDYHLKGGDGGRGGVGGNGGNGARGTDGLNATRYSNGTNGGPGGNGGDGGWGSDGADGGRGGNVVISLDYEDIYLLMSVGGCDPKAGTGDRLRGGTGGPAGRHGVGGRGGAGGRGGNSYSWSESYYDSSSNQMRMRTRTNMGGWNGRKGKKGKTPSHTLLPGNDGSDGTLQIDVTLSDGGHESFRSRYDLEFRSTETDQLSNMIEAKTFEFGETVLVTSIKLQNTGMMPSPTQRSMISVDCSNGVIVNKDERLFLERGSCIDPGTVGDAGEGLIHFECPYPSLSEDTDNDPVSEQGWVRYMAYQLGPENEAESPAQLSDFQVKYPRFHDVPTGESFKMTHPLENRDGIRGVRSLAAQETTFLQFTLTNVSNHSFGEDSGTGRKLFILFYYADDKDYEIPIESIQVRGEHGQLVRIDPSSTPKGYRRDIPFVTGGGETTVQLSLKIASDQVQTAARAALQADVYLQKIPILSLDGQTEQQAKKRLIQRRIFVVSCQPKFQENTDSDIVLVTTTATCRDQVESWEYVVEEQLGLRSQVYSLSRYGHLDASETAEETELEESFREKTVVVLNDEFVAQPNERFKRKDRTRPSQLLNSIYDFAASTRFLIVGGERQSVEHLSPNKAAVNKVLSPTRAMTCDSSPNSSPTSPSSPNRKSFRKELRDSLLSERESGFVAERVSPSYQVVKVKTKSFRKPSEERVESILQRRAAQTEKWLHSKDPLRPYNVAWYAKAHPTHVESKKGMLGSCWEVGELRVFTGSPRFSNSIVVVDEERAVDSFKEAASIRSLPMLYATINSLPIALKLRCWTRSIRALSVSPPHDVSVSHGDHENVCMVVNDCLVGDFLLDVYNYLDGRMDIEAAKDRSSTIQGLIEDINLAKIMAECNDEQLQTTLQKNLSRLLAGFICVAESKDLKPLWNPWGRRRSVSKQMHEAVALLEKCYWAQDIDEDMIKRERTEIETWVASHIRDDRKKRMVRWHGRWRKALKYHFSPYNVRRYPRALGFHATNTSIRKEFEVGTSATSMLKIRPSSTETLSPDMTKHLKTEQDSRRFFQTDVLQSTASADQLYRLPS